MRAFPAIIFLLGAGCCVAQSDTCPAMDSTAVVRMENTSAEELYARARRWFALAYKDGAVVHTTDTIGHTIVGKTMAPYPGGGWVHCTVEIGCREDRYKYRVYDIRHDDPRASTQVLDDGVVDAHPDLGSFYDCDVCCSFHRAWMEAHPKQVAEHARHVQECRTNILVRSRSAISGVVSSLRSGMEVQMATEKDW